MNTELARDLQYRITKEALAMLVIHGSAAETDDYERAIILIGSAWGLDPQNAVSHLELITRERKRRVGPPNRRRPATSCRKASCP